MVYFTSELGFCSKIPISSMDTTSFFLSPHNKTVILISFVLIFSQNFQFYFIQKINCLCCVCLWLCLFIGSSVLCLHIWLVGNAVSISTVNHSYIRYSQTGFFHCFKHFSRNSNTLKQSWFQLIHLNKIQHWKFVYHIYNIIC